MLRHESIGFLIGALSWEIVPRRVVREGSPDKDGSLLPRLIRTLIFWQEAYFIWRAQNIYIDFDQDGSSRRMNLACRCCFSIAALRAEHRSFIYGIAS